MKPFGFELARQIFERDVRSIAGKSPDEAEARFEDWACLAAGQHRYLIVVTWTYPSRGLPSMGDRAMWATRYTGAFMDSGETEVVDGNVGFGSGIVRSWWTDA